MRFRKRYIIMAIPILLLITCQMEFLAFRKNDQEQADYILKRLPKSEPSFFVYNYQGQKIHYTQMGHDSLPLLILLHGAPGSSSAFMSYLADSTLLSKVQVIAVDRPGYGYSGYGKVEPSLQRQSRVLAPLIEKYSHRPIFLLGHSYGGPVIVQIAADFPDQIAGLIMVAGSVSPEAEPQEWWRHPLNWKAIRWMLPPSFRVCNQEIIPLKEELKKLVPEWKKITVPVTVIQGQEDKLVPAENADFAEQHLMNSRQPNIIRLEGEGHFILWTLQDFIVKNTLEMVENVQ